MYDTVSNCQSYKESLASIHTRTTSLLHTKLRITKYAHCHYAFTLNSSAEVHSLSLLTLHFLILFVYIYSLTLCTIISNICYFVYFLLFIFNWTLFPKYVYDPFFKIHNTFLFCMQQKKIIRKYLFSMMMSNLWVSYCRF